MIRASKIIPENFFFSKSTFETLEKGFNIDAKPLSSASVVEFWQVKVCWDYLFIFFRRLIYICKPM